MTVVELTKKLISLPSYDDGKNFEKPVSDFLVAYIKENLPWFNVTLQKVAPNRFNIFLQDSAPTKFLVVDQIDTVIPDKDWSTDPLAAKEEEGKIFGLGSSDSKGNVAAFLCALKEYGETKGLAVLLYVDEEYFFEGMKFFVSSDLATSIKPATILSIDGNGTALGLGCRGLIEFDITLRSETGHSANPKIQGALNSLTTVFQKFQNRIATKESLLGVSTAQIAFLQGGCVIGEDQNGFIFAKEGNRIPNYVNAKIEIRSIPELDFKQVQEFFLAELKQFELTEVSITPVFDYSGFSTYKEEITPVVQAVEKCLGKVPLLDPSTFGYLDVAMLKNVFPNAALCSFGIGQPGVAHKANEYVRVDQLEKSVKIYQEVIDYLIGDQT